MDLNPIIKYIREAHKGQKYGDEDYFEGHLVKVAEGSRELAKRLGRDEEIAYVLGLAHDLDEDQKDSIEGFYKLLKERDEKLAEWIFAGLSYLTHREVEGDYFDYIRVIGEGRHIYSMIVKYIDLTINIEKSEAEGGTFKKLPLYKFAHLYLKEKLIRYIL